MKVFQPNLDITADIRKEQQVTTLPTQLLQLVKRQQQQQGPFAQVDEKQ